MGFFPRHPAEIYRKKQHYIRQMPSLTAGTPHARVTLSKFCCNYAQLLPYTLATAVEVARPFEHPKLQNCTHRDADRSPILRFQVASSFFFMLLHRPRVCLVAPAAALLHPRVYLAAQGTHPVSRKKTVPPGKSFRFGLKLECRDRVTLYIVPFSLTLLLAKNNNITPLPRTRARTHTQTNRPSSPWKLAPWNGAACPTCSG